MDDNSKSRYIMFAYDMLNRSSSFSEVISALMQQMNLSEDEAYEIYHLSFALYLEKFIIQAKTNLFWGILIIAFGVVSYFFMKSFFISLFVGFFGLRYIYISLLLILKLKSNN